MIRKTRKTLVPRAKKALVFRSDAGFKNALYRVSEKVERDLEGERKNRRLPSGIDKILRTVVR